MSENLSLVSNSNGFTISEIQNAEDKSRFARNFLDTMAGETLRAYRSRFASFAAWCSAAGRESMPATPATVSAYLEYLETSGHKASTINQVVAAISKAHKAAGVEVNPCASDEVKTARKAASRRLGTAPHAKAAATLNVTRTVVAGITGKSLVDLRDKALLLVGFYGAFRRSELVGLRCSDLAEEKDKGGRPVVVVTVRKSKTDQEGRGMTKAIFAAPKEFKSVCPVRALRDWIAAAGISGEDYLFPSIKKGGKLSGVALSGHAVAHIIQNRAASAGVELELSGHSLRRGFVTSAVEKDASERSIMNQTGHKSAATLRRYIERHDAISDNAAALL